jgi:hypothetical protein
VAREFLYQADEVRREAREAGLEFVAAELGVAIDRAGRASLDEVFRPLAAESEAAGRRASR